MKKIVLSVLLSLSFFNLYAGTGVGDYEHSTEYLSSDVYVADYDGVDVKERPDENHKELRILKRNPEEFPLKNFNDWSFTFRS